METTQTSTIVSGETRSGWRKTDTMWMLGLYGTAIGAGVLFLPINAGVGGMIPPDYHGDSGLPDDLLRSPGYDSLRPSPGKTRAKTSPKWWKNTSA